MTIAVVCDVLGEENNGTTIATMTLIRHLKSRGHTVRIVCADQEKKGMENVFVVPNLNFGKLLNRYVAKVGVSLAKADTAILTAALEGVDHVHVMLPFSLGMATAKIAGEKGLPITAGFHMQAENFTSYIKLNKLSFLNKAVYTYIYTHFYRYVDAIHYPTQFIKDVFESNIKKQTRGYVISNGVHGYVQKREVKKPDFCKDKFVILSTGRYAKEKAQDVLIKAVALSQHKENIQLILAGQGVKQAYYEKLAKRLPVAPIMQFFSRKEIVDVLNYADLYVHPAEMELEGISCLEAIVCGKLTMVSDSPLSATKGFAADNRCIFKRGNAKDLAAKIDYFIEHPAERERCEQLYLQKSCRFDQEACMQQMENMIMEVYREKKST